MGAQVRQNVLILKEATTVDVVKGIFQTLLLHVKVS